MIKRDDFITRLASKGYTKHDAGIIMDDFITTIEEALISGESIMFRGFGTFELRDRAQREGVDLRTKERIIIPARRQVYFSEGKLLKREIKEGRLRH